MKSRRQHCINCHFAEISLQGSLICIKLVENGVDIEKAHVDGSDTCSMFTYEDAENEEGD